MLSATPSVTLGLPSQALIGQSISFTAAFANTSATTTGYGPYIDLVFPNNGAQDPLPVGATQDGISFVNATYLGQPVTSYVMTFPAGPGGSTTGTLTHPFAVDNTGAPLQITGNEGDTLVVLQLPFGSVTPNQPSIPITVNATLSNQARVGTPLTVEARAGFQFGDDPLNNPTTDPPLNSDPASNSSLWDSAQGLANTSTTPTVWLPLVTTYNGPEDETATGPNFPRSYTFSVEVANGQTITNVNLTDLLPNNLQYLSLVSASPGGYTVQQQPTTGAAQNAPNNKLSILWPSVTGTGSPNDITATFSFFVPQNDANGQPVLPPSTGAFTTSTETPAIQGVYTPTNPANPVINPLTNTVTGDLVLNDKSLAIQKTVSDLSAAPGPKPGDTLAYTLNVQFSDYFAFQNVVITDTLGDGQDAQLADTGFTPTLTFLEHGQTLASINLNPADYTISAQDPTTGATTLTFNLSKQLADSGLSAKILGGLVGGSFGGTYGTITYHALVANAFLAPQPAPHTQSVDAGDVLGNSVVMSGDVLNTTTLLPTGSSISDNSGDSLLVVQNALAKTIYAVDGTVVGSGNLQIEPGDTVTYRLQYSMPTPNYEQLNIVDYLPLPIYDATTLTTFNPVVSAAAPAVGTAKFGPADTYFGYQGVVPALSTDSTSNSVTFNYGSNHNNAPQATQIDLLFTLLVGSQPFADGLYLTNRAAVTEGTTNNGPLAIQQATQVVRLDEPTVSIHKGVVATNDAAATFTPAQVGPAGVTFNAPGSSPEFSGTINSTNLHAGGTFAIGSSLAGIQASDLVTFAVVAENTGSAAGGAYDLTFQDTIPAGFAVPAGGLNMHVVNGAGTALAYTDLGGGLFGTGIKLNNPVGPGMDPTGATTINDGKNIVVITYDLQAQTSVTPRQTLTNTADLTNYSSTPGGPNFIPSGLNANANVTVTSPTAGKALVGTSIVNANNSNTQAVIGETVTYSVTVNVPQGTIPGAAITDTLSPGLAFVALTGVSSNSAALTSSLGAFSNTAAFNPTLTNNGQTAAFNLGTLTDTDTNDATTETLTLTYTAVVLNVAGNTAGAALKNSAAFAWTGGSLPAVQAAPVTVVEPKATIVNGYSTSSSGPFTTPLTNVDGGNTIYYEVQFTNPAAGSTDALAATLNDPLPSALTSPSVFSVTGAAAGSFTVAGGPLQTASPLADVAPGATVTVIVQGTLSSSLPAGQPVSDTATLKWTSLGNASQITTNNPNAYERTGTTTDPGGALNTYTTTATATIQPNPPSLAKTLVDTSLDNANNGKAQAVIGERAIYSLTISVPQGTTTGATIVDTLPAGLAFVSFDSISATSDLVSSKGAFNTTNDAPTVTNNGQTVTFNLGDISHNPSSTTPLFSTITLTYEAVVLNIATNITGKVLSNSAVFSWSGGSTAAQSASVTVIEPTLALTNKVSSSSSGPWGATLAGRQAGDTVFYQLVIANPSSNSTDAYNDTLSDTLPFQLTGTSVLSVTDTASTINASNFTITGGVLQTTGTGLPDMAPGQTVTVIVQGTLSVAVTPKSTIADTASLQWTSIPGSPGQISTFNASSTERTGAGVPLNTYFTSASSSITPTVSVTDSKTLLGTSINNANNSNTQAVIGELVNYSVTITIPQGTTPAATVVDTLNAGLAFVSLNSITTNNAAAVTSSVGAFANTALFNPTVTLSGQKATFNLGNLVDTDTNDATSETVTLNYSAVVLNVAGNTTGKQLTNSAVFSWTGNTLGAVTAAKVTVVEPTLTLTNKVSNNSAGPFGATLAGAQAGDTVYYQLVIANPAANSTDAYDDTLSDTLPFQLTDTSVLSVTDTAGTINASNFTISSGVVQTTGTGLPDVAPGQTVTVIVQGTLSVAVTPNSTIPDTATLQWTSLPGSPGQITVNNASSTERTGSGVAPNSYFTSSNNSITPTLSVTDSKSLVGTSIVGTGNSNTQAAIGELVNYAVTITIPQGTTPAATLVDTLNSGLAFVRLNSITTNNAAVTSSVGAFTNTALFNPTVTGSGQVATFNLGNLVDTDTNDATSETVTLNYSAVVLNVAGNVAGTQLGNSAVFSWTGNTLAAVAAPKVTVVEPKLTITDGVSTSATGPFVTNLTGVEGYEPLYYQVVITNPSNQPAAFNTVLSDALPAVLTSPTLSVTGFNPAAFTISGGVLQTTGGEVDVPGGTTITLLVSGTTAPTTTPNLTVTNSATTTWTSIPGSATTAESTYNALSTGRTGNTGDPGGALNNYTATASNQFVTTSPSAAKALAATSIIGPSNSLSQAVIGETATYTVTLSIPSGLTPSAVVTDTLPAGLGFVGLNSVTASTGTITSTVGAFSNTAAFAPTITNGGRTLTFNLGNVSDSNPNNTGTDTLTLNYTARVLDVAGNVSGTTLHNSAVLSWTGNTLAAVSAPNVTVIEPKLQVTKTPSTASPAYNQVVTYTVTVAHTAGSNADANNVVLTDVIPSGMTYLSASLPAGVTVNTSGSPTIVFTIASLPLATGSVTFTYQAQVAAPGAIPLRTNLTNPIATTWTSLPGADPNARTGAGGVDNYNTNTSSTVTVTGPDLSLTKTQPAGIVHYGDTVNYTLTVTNSGNGGATGVVLSDPLPPNTTFVSADQGGTLSGGVVTWPSFALAASSSRQFHLSITVGPPNGAATQVQTVALTPTDWSQTLTLPQFNPATGILTSVVVQDNATLSTQVGIENLSSVAQNIVWSVTGTATVTGPGTNLSTGIGLVNQTFAAPKFDGTLDYGGTSGVTYPWQNSSPGQATTTLIGAAMAPFVGTGTVGFTEAVAARSAFSGGSLMKFVHTNASGNVTVIYSYSEPTTLTNTASVTYNEAALDPTPADDTATNSIALSMPQRLDPSSPPPIGPAAPLTQAQLNRAAHAAIAEWAAAGASASDLAKLRSVEFQIAPLAAGLLGAETPGPNGRGIVTIDTTADGYGWNTGRRAGRSHHVDLVTVVAHEFGHVLGLPDIAAGTKTSSIMAEDLGLGVTRVPRPGDLGRPAHRRGR